MCIRDRLDTITNDGTDITLDSSGDIILDAGGANVTIKDDGTSILDIANNSSDIELTVSVADKNFKIKGTDDSSAITALDIDMALAGKATYNGDVVVGGDLTVTGDDITMGTNTAGHLLIADGTNFNAVAATSLSEISTIASDDVLLAVDTSGGGLKKVARSTLVSGLATSSAISNVSEDTSPQLGGDLDMNGQDIVSTSNADIEIAPNGTGHLTVKGNTNPGTIQLNCENNSHGVQIKSPAHSAGSSAVLTLPTATGNLIGTGDSSTVTNGMLATINTAGKVDIGALEIDGATDIGADLTTSDLIIVDDGANGTERKAALSRVVTLMSAQGFVTDDPTALAIALG